MSDGSARVVLEGWAGDGVVRQGFPKGGETLAKFNLIEEAWIPVLRDGRVVEVGLKEALLQAQEIARIESPSPLEEAALHRLLLAVLYRALPDLKDQYDLEGLLEEGGFPSGAILEYLDRYHDRFYLFHDTAPFLQIPDLPQDDPRPWTSLVPQLASGNNPTLFDHSLDDSPLPISYPEAARALLVHQAFAPGGLLRRMGVVSAKDAPLARPAVFLVEGENLFQTLMLNLVPQEDTEKALWERPPLQSQEVWGYRTKWPLQGVSLVYVWPSRGILLLDDGDGVRWTAYGPGVEPVDVAWRDPMVAYREDKKGNVLALRLNMDRSFWRDFAAMQPSSGGRLPAVLTHAAGFDHLDQAFSLRVLGQVSDQAKILDIRREVYPFSKAMLTPKGELLLKKGLELAESTASGLTSVTWLLAREVLGDRDRTELENFVKSLPLMRLFWHRLDADFPKFVRALQDEGALDLWRQVLRQAALWAWGETERFVGTEARHLKALVKARGALAGVLSKLEDAEAPPGAKGSTEAKGEVKG